MIRLWQGGDSLSELTVLLHRAYAPLAAQGMRFLASHQDEAKTRARITEGECHVALWEGRLAGTICFYGPEKKGGTPHYDRADVAFFGQFAVEPSLQGKGIGTALLNWVERRAIETGAKHLALDTAEGARRVIAFYESRGFRFVEFADWRPVTNYRSVIMSKSLL